MRGIRHLLPATAPEIAAQCGITIKQAHGRLSTLARSKRAKRSEKKVPNGNTKRGAHNSILWVRV